MCVLGFRWPFLARGGAGKSSPVPPAGRRQARPRALTLPMCLVVLLFGALARPAQASNCYAAATQGTAPANYLGYCWLDFTGYSDAQAQAGGGAPVLSPPLAGSLSIV